MRTKIFFLIAHNIQRGMVVGWNNGTMEYLESMQSVNDHSFFLML